MEQHDVELQQPRELSRLSEGFSSPWNVLVLDRKPNSRRGRVGDADRAGSSSTLDVGLGGSVPKWWHRIERFESEVQRSGVEVLRATIPRIPQADVGSFRHDKRAPREDKLDIELWCSDLRAVVAGNVFEVDLERQH